MHLPSPDGTPFTTVTKIKSKTIAQDMKIRISIFYLIFQNTMFFTRLTMLYKWLHECNDAVKQAVKSILRFFFSVNNKASRINYKLHLEFPDVCLMLQTFLCSSSEKMSRTGRLLNILPWHAIIHAVTARNKLDHAIKSPTPVPHDCVPWNYNWNFEQYVLYEWHHECSLSANYQQVSGVAIIQPNDTR